MTRVNLVRIAAGLSLGAMVLAGAGLASAKVSSSNKNTGAGSINNASNTVTNMNTTTVNTTTVTTNSASLGINTGDNSSYGNTGNSRIHSGGVNVNINF